MRARGKTRRPAVGHRAGAALRRSGGRPGLAAPGQKRRAAAPADGRAAAGAVAVRFSRLECAPRCFAGPFAAAGGRRGHAASFTSSSAAARRSKHRCALPACSARLAALLAGAQNTCAGCCRAVAHCPGDRMYWIALLPSHEDERIAWGWRALQFTPRVAQVDEALLLEASASLRLWGGRKGLLRRLLQETAAPGARAMGAGPHCLGRPWACCACNCAANRRPARLPRRSSARRADRGTGACAHAGAHRLPHLGRVAGLAARGRGAAFRRRACWRRWTAAYGRAARALSPGSRCPRSST